jgi:dihydroorotate dehydrogenase electron transfer subunit
LGLDIGSEKIRLRRVIRNVRENRSINTVYFKDEGCSSAKPGQFVMVWEPGFDEFPMSLSHYDAEGICSVTVKPWGPGSNELVRAKRGDLIGIRGPYGRPYTVERCSSLLVGGGTGLAPMLPLAKALLRAGGKVGVVIGGRSKADLLFEKQMQRIVKKTNLYLTTDDGSHGHTGFASDLAERLIAERKVSRVYTCGPEVMMRKLYDISAKAGIDFEASLERNMKCGIGICGSCAVGKNLLCRDGAVLDSDALKGSLDEFGLLQRDPSGRYIRI